MLLGAAYLPNQDLEKFILLEVVRPQVESFRDKGCPVIAQTVLIAGDQRKSGPKLGSVGKGTHVVVDIHCHAAFTNETHVICHCKCSELEPSLALTFEWTLHADVHRDEKGFYIHELRTSLPARPRA